jgi:hypothetical protein
VLDAGDGGVGGVRVAGFVFFVPEVEVGLVLMEDEKGEGGGCDGREGCGVVTVGGGLIVETEDVCGREHVGVR